MRRALPDVDRSGTGTAVAAHTGAHAASGFRIKGGVILKGVAVNCLLPAPS